MGAIYVTNTASTVVAANSVVPISINRRVGCNYKVVNNAILLGRPTYYKISGTITFTAAEAGDVTISLQENGVDIPGITATETISTANTEVRTISIQGLLRVFCHNGIPALTLVNNSSIDITTANVSLSIID